MYVSHELRHEQICSDVYVGSVFLDGFLVSADGLFWIIHFEIGVAKVVVRI